MARFSLMAMLGLDTKGFQKGINGARQQTGAFKKMWMKLGPLLSTAAFVQVGRSAIRLGSELNDLARQTRTNVESLQALRHVARETGASNNALERALRNVTTRTEDALDGNTRLSDAFQRLGINIEEFNRLPTERKLEELAKAQRNAGDSTRAFSDVARILGERSGPELQGVLDTLAKDGFDGVRDAADEAGQIMSQRAAASMDLLSNTGTGLKNRFVVLAATILHNLIPPVRILGQGFGVVGDFIRMLVRNLNALGRMFGTLVSVAIQPTISAFKILGHAATAAGRAMRLDFAGAREALGEMRQEARDAAEAAADSVRDTGGAFKEFGDEIKANAANAFNDIADRSDKLGDAWADMLDRFGGDSESAIEEFSDDYREAADGIEDDNERIAKSIRKVNREAETFASVIKKAYEAAIAEQRRLVDEDVLEKEMRSLQARADGQQDIADAIDDQIDLQEKALRIAERHNIAYSDALKLVQQIADAEHGRGRAGEGISRAMGGVPAGREMEGIRQAANEIGKETGRRFQRVAGHDGETRFRELQDGRVTGREFTPDQMKDAIDERIQDDESNDLLEQIRDALRGKFVNE